MAGAGQKPSRGRLVAACAALAVGAIVCAAGLASTFGGAPTAVHRQAATGAGPAVERGPAADGPEADGPAAVGDLLAACGSYGGEGPVPHVFAPPGPAASPARTVRGGRSEAGAGLWEGPDPPPLRVGFVLVADGVARAVVDGRVVGVGDRVAGGAVVAIARDHVQVRGAERTLTYDLTDPWPREFRTELLQRAAPPPGGLEAAR